LKKHYCQHKLENVSFLPLEKCCKSKAHSSCKQQASNYKKGCCSSEFEYVHLDQELLTQEYEVVSFKQLNLLSSSIKHHWIQPIEITFTQNFLSYKPPIVQSDISVLFQIFRL
jgi:hypothetical protein